MGASSSTANVRPYPAEWLPKDATEAQHELAMSAVRALSAMDPERFLQVAAPLEELEDTVWGPAWDSASRITSWRKVLIQEFSMRVSMGKAI